MRLILYRVLGAWHLLMFGRSPDDFRRILAPNLGAQGEGSKVVVGWLFWLLAPSWGQDGHKMPQEASRQPSKTDFGAISADFSIDCWLMFDQFLLNSACTVGGLLVCCSLLCWLGLAVCLLGCLSSLLSCWLLGSPTPDPVAGMARRATR